MNQLCLLCDRRSADGNLYCEQTYCPGELSPWVLEQGERFADVEIARPAAFLRSGVLYAAVRQDKPVYVKVAHQGAQHKERLKREAQLLAVAQVKNVAAPFLPALLPAHAATPETRNEPYGKTVVAGQLLYYFVCEYLEAESLAAILRKQPQLWISHVGWIAIQLATAVDYLHRRGRFHFGLCPESVLVRFDKEPPHTPRILLVDLGLCAPGDQFASLWYQRFMTPAYAAPELIDERSAPFSIKQNGSAVAPDVRTDVYGLGIILYEMLVGKAPIEHLLRSDADVLKAVVNGQRAPMERLDDVKRIAELALQACDLKLARRPSSPAAFAQPLLAYFGDVPEERKRRGPSQRAMLMVAGALLAIAFLVSLAFSLSLLAS